MDKNFALALYGSVIATSVLIWDVIKFVNSRASLKITVTRKDVFIVESSLPYIIINIVNKGKEPLTIAGSGFEFEPKSNHKTCLTRYISHFKKHISWTAKNTDVAKELTQGQQCEVLVSLQDINNQTIVRAWAMDTIGKKYYSKWYPYTELDLLELAQKLK